jgi:predicted RND superfamily exporter protein
MLVDLINSFVTAFGIITVMMILLMIGFARGHLRQASRRSDRMRIVLARTFAGVVSMIPNLIPCVLVLGGMGLAGIPLDIGSIMTAGVALGIAVDDTLHFITWFCRGLQDGRSRSEAVEYAYSRCASAMTQTSLICGLGLLVYGFSDFVPIARFAWLMFAMLFAAVLADLIILPAVLLGPLGKLFHYPQNCESR